MVAVSGNRDLANLAGVRVRLRDPFGHSRFNDGPSKRARERVRTHGFTGVLVRIYVVNEERFGLTALFLYPVAAANGNTLLPFPIDVGLQIRNEVVRYIDVALDQPLRPRDVHRRESLRVAAGREIENLKDGELGDRGTVHFLAERSDVPHWHMWIHVSVAD